MVLRLRVPDSHSDCPLGEKYGAAEEACSELVRASGLHYISHTVKPFESDD